MTKNELPEFRNLELPAKRNIKNPNGEEVCSIPFIIIDKTTTKSEAI